MQNPPESPWFDWVVAGVKRYEGRVRRGEWAQLRVGEHVEFYEDTGRRVVVRVEALPHYDNFAAAFGAHGAELVPVAGADAAMVTRLYGQYFSDADVSENGVVAIKMQVVCVAHGHAGTRAL